MRRLSGLVLLIGLVTVGCGSASDTSVGSLGEDAFGGIGQASGDVAPEGQGSSGGGTLENPTPEASSPLPSDSIRIGEAVWERAIPTDGQCFVQEDDGTIAASGTAWGSVKNDPEVDFNVSQDQDGSVEAQVRSNLMDWVSGFKDGTELTVQLDFVTSSIIGDWLFYNGHTNEWAYGSFAFTCSDSE